MVTLSRVSPVSVNHFLSWYQQIRFLPPTQLAQSPPSAGQPLPPPLQAMASHLERLPSLPTSSWAHVPRSPPPAAVAGFPSTAAATAPLLMAAGVGGPPLAGVGAGALPLPRAGSSPLPLAGAHPLVSVAVADQLKALADRFHRVADGPGMGPGARVAPGPAPGAGVALPGVGAPPLSAEGPGAAPAAPPLAWVCP
jgi:hypothetical protein